MLLVKNKREDQIGNHGREEDNDPFRRFYRCAWNLMRSSLLAKEDSVMSHYRGDVPDLQNNGASAQGRCQSLDESHPRKGQK